MGVSSDGCSSPAGPQIKFEHRSTKCSRLREKKQQPQFFALAQILCSLSHPSKPRQAPPAAGIWCRSSTHTREIQASAMPGSKPLTEAHPAMSRQRGSAGVRSNNCYYCRQEGHSTANKRKQSNDSSKVSYKFPAESDLPAFLKSLSQTHSSEQIQT